MTTWLLTVAMVTALFLAPDFPPSAKLESEQDHSTNCVQTKQTNAITPNTEAKWISTVWLYTLNSTKVDFPSVLK